MNNFTKLIGAGILTLICTTGAQSDPLSKSLVDDPVLEAVKRTGTSVQVDTAMCRRKKFFGLYEYGNRPYIDRLTICLSRHEGDVEELMDTIRHEAIHVAQACRGGEIFSRGYVAKLADPEVRKTVTTDYSKDDWESELEAFVIADHATHQEVAKLVTKECKR